VVVDVVLFFFDFRTFKDDNLVLSLFDYLFFLLDIGLQGFVESALAEALLQYQILLSFSEEGTGVVLVGGGFPLPSLANFDEVIPRTNELVGRKLT
jgi:hypothetical protein